MYMSTLSGRYTGRYTNTLRSDQCICQHCHLHEIEDEYHFILICPKYSNVRLMYIKKYM